MNRRDFLGKSCLLCLSVAGLAASATALSSCSTIPSAQGKSEGNDKNVLRVSKAAFKDSNALIVRNAALLYDILLVKNGETIIALNMQCTHQDNPLTVTKTGLYCSAHGSRFNLEGRPTAPPADRPLKRFPTKLDQGDILIQITP